MRKFNQFSLVDFLTNVLNIDSKIVKDAINPKAVNALYSIWKNPKNKIGNRIYKRPTDIKQSDLDDLVSSGLVSKAHNGLKITNKGSNIIRTMILGDDRSSYEENGQDVDYVTASKNTNLRKKNKKASDQWWGRINGKK